MEKVKTKKIQIRCLSLLVIALISLIFSDQIMALTPPAIDGPGLIENAKSLNGQEITFQGEVVGDIMPRQDHYWINVLSNGTAIGIWITSEQRTRISHSGQYGSKGDQVEIEGLFQQACAEHGGDLDIHANSLVVVSDGSILPQHLNIIRLAVAAGLFILAIGCLSILFRKRYLNKNPKIR